METAATKRPEHGTHGRYNTCKIRVTTVNGVTFGRPCWACTQAAKVWAEAWFESHGKETA